MTNSKWLAANATRALCNWNYGLDEDRSDWKKLRGLLHAAAYASPYSEKHLADRLGAIDVAMTAFYDAVSAIADGHNPESGGEGPTLAQPTLPKGTPT